MRIRAKHSYLEAGCKLLCLVESDSSLASLVEESEIGSVCNQPATADDVANSITDEFQSWKQSEYDRDAIQRVGRAHFGQQVILDFWLRLLNGENPTPPGVGDNSKTRSATTNEATQSESAFVSAD